MRLNRGALLPLFVGVRASHPENKPQTW